MAVAATAQTSPTVPHETANAGRPLADALRDVARRTGIDIAFSPAVVEGHRVSTGASEGSADKALAQLLAGTNLIARRASAGGYVVEPRAVSAAPVRPALSQADEGALASDIVVTGSRVERSALASASPVTTLTDTRIMQSGVANIGDLLMQTPSVSVGEGSRNSAQVFLNLRGLGTNRTLTVVDGRRRVSGSAVSSAVDLSIYPSALIERIEIVTGGASAIYGADAVTGAVNVILKRDYEGLQASGRIGLTGEGSSKDYLASVVGGGTFHDGRGSVTVALAYQRIEPLRASSRKFYRDNGDIILGANPKNTGPNDGIFDQIVYTDAVFPTYAYEGIFALGGQRYLVEGGQLRPVRHDATPQGPLGTIAQGGDGYNNRDFDHLRRQVETISSIGRLSYEVIDGVRLFADVEYANKKSISPGVGDFDLSSVIRIDNYFVPAAMRDLMTQNGVQQVTVTRSSRDQGVRRDHSTADVLTVAGGVEGEFSNGWDYNAFIQHGSFRQTTQTFGRRISARYAEAVDVIADPVSGDPVCRSASARAAGCLPVNILGETQSSPAALKYFMPVLTSSFEQTQDIAGLQLKGDVIELPAGPIKAAVGGEWRQERLQRRDDALTLSGAVLFLTGFQPIDAKFNVKEAFAEVLVPVLADRPFARSLDIEGAVRVSDYSTIGSTVAWKLGANWAIDGNVRLRGSIARSVRAPNLFELYNPGITGVTGTLQDPCSAALINANAQRTANCRAQGVPEGYVDPTIGSTRSLLTGGNPDLKEETSKSHTAGIILTPGFLPGLTWTTDWWKIRIDNAASTIDAQTAAYACYDAASLDNVYCSLFERGGFDRVGNGDAHSITLVRQNVINIGRLSAEGIDTQLSYIHHFGEDTRLQLLFNGTYLLKNELLGNLDDPRTLLIQDGEVDNPRFRGTLQANYSTGPWSVGLVGRFISAAKADQQASKEFRDRNHANARLYTDINAGYRFSESVSIFGGVNNLTNTNPPLLPEAVQASRSGLYDSMGRTFFLGGNISF
ncbi:TonB-dependent receptor [Sandaracinobacter sp. RS1-74]|uniref:TonB-dependent receptor n=1 Tax=Sandaracinobacteroides sayramensis TaxID=2913411 RepID=UPI001EDAC788|nr:TonB-dependent receptor [Sandaracinobacteroides sayramensis]MCG2842577.1 TonB-dependent receptor [Sandaracinobacteroides sayramensis]